jgi:hypothetical protein
LAIVASLWYVVLRSVTPPENGILTLTAKKATEQKKFKERGPRSSHKLTRVEAEIMFVIWKSGTSLSSTEIAAQHAARFGFTKKEVTIRGIIYDIRCLEKAAKRKYLQPSGGSRGEYRINKESFVDLQWTAIILLELDKGYKHIVRQIERDLFEKYLSNKYGWNKGLIDGRIEYCVRSHYISFYELEPGKQCINVLDRLKHDIEYLKLLVEDYYLEEQREDPPPSIVHHLANLVALYRSDKTSTKAIGGNT